MWSYWLVRPQLYLIVTGFVLLTSVTQVVQIVKTPPGHSEGHYTSKWTVTTQKALNTVDTVHKAKINSLRPSDEYMPR